MTLIIFFSKEFLPETSIFIPILFLQRYLKFNMLKDTKHFLNMNLSIFLI